LLMIEKTAGVYADPEREREQGNSGEAGAFP
jgi:hypothetical protein